MSGYTIFHNPRCSTSRKALAMLKESGIEPKIVEYLKHAPSEEEITKLVAKLGVPAEALVRTKEPLYKEKYQGLKLNEHEWVRVMHENPQLIERPVVVKGHKAVIGRPLENVEELINKK
ncbi:MAG TPA: arsenate reductase (glutaredoxin) [Flavobacteriales bacterium]|mgnify:CR=1 FL=1|nr:arsenate reductase (glutaredoxin) [Flavobacteriales bacterium]